MGKKKEADVHPSQMANEHMKNHSPGLVIRAMQSKTTSRHYFTPSEMTTIRRTDHTKCWQRGGAMRHCYFENSTTTLKNSLEVPEKVKHTPIMCSSHCALRYFTQEG